MVTREEKGIEGGCRDDGSMSTFVTKGYYMRWGSVVVVLLKVLL